MCGNHPIGGPNWVIGTQADAIGVRESSSGAALDGDGAASDRRVQSKRVRTTLELRWQKQRLSIP